MPTNYHHIRLANGRVYYSGVLISLADAQVMINDDITERRLHPGAFLRVEGVELVVEQPRATGGATYPGSFISDLERLPGGASVGGADGAP